MSAKTWQEGVEIDHTPTGAVTGGDVVIVGARAGVANNDIPANEKGALAIEGVFAVDKASATVFADDANVQYTGGLAVTTGGSHIGRAIVGSGNPGGTNGETFVLVKLNSPVKA